MKKESKDKNRFKFFDKNFNEVAIETEDKWDKIVYGIDFKRKEIELCDIPLEENEKKPYATISFNEVETLYNKIKGLCGKIEG